ncbi:MAG: ornithine cyclodeaminase family protein [Pseudomonadota bacterium]
MKTRIIRSQDLAALVAKVGLDEIMDRMIERLAETCREFDPQRFEVRVRDGYTYEQPRVGLIEWMPVMEAGRRVTVKMVGYHPRNPSAFQLPTILSTVGAYDTDTGHLIGLSDATFLTAVRTAAASAVASQILARPDSRVLGIVGVGAQAVCHVHALSRCFPLEQVLIYDVDPAAVASFAQRVAGLSPRPLEIAPATGAQILARSDMLVTATSVAAGAGPVVDDGHCQPGLHVNAVGADFPGKTELPLTLLQRALVCPDYSPQAMKEGECQRLEADQIGPDLLQITKQAATMQAHQDRLTVFDSTGFALEDHVALELALEWAEQFNLGLELDLESISDDPLNPYQFAEVDRAVAAVVS